MTTRYYFTFGGSQPLKDYYVLVEAKTYFGARELVLQQFGRCWSMQYSQEEWSGMWDQDWRNSLTQIGPLEADHHHERKALERRELNYE